MVQAPFLLSSIPAKWNDDLLLVCPNYRHAFSSPVKFAARALSILINATVFPLFLALDTCYYSAKSIYLKSITLLYCQESDATHNKVYRTAVKCLRGMATWPAGLGWPDIVSNHFLSFQAADGKIHPKGKLYVGEGVVHTPESMEQVVAVVKAAIKSNKKISIAGAGYCQGKQTLPCDKNDLHINMQKINHVIIDKEKMIAKVGAGATWNQIQNKADSQGLAVQVMQASNVFSIGGSLSANCHGWDHTQGTVANTVLSITFIDAKGVKKTVTPKDPEFQYLVGGYGLFGVILEVEIQLTDNQELYAEGEHVLIDEYPKYFDEKVQTNPQIKMHLYRLSLQRGSLLKKGYAQNYVIKTQSSKTENLQDDPPGGTESDTIIMHIARNSFTFRNLYWKSTEWELSSIKKSTRNETMRPKIEAAFVTRSNAYTEWLQEYFVPKNKLTEFLRFLSDVLNENDVALLNASVRYVKQDTKAALGYAKRGDRFAIVLFFSQSLNADEVKKTEKWVQRVIDKLNTIKGSFYLPYMHFATKEQFQKSYPQWKEIQKAKELYDPEGRFNNGLYQDYFKGV